MLSVDKELIQLWKVFDLVGIVEQLEGSIDKTSSKRFARLWESILYLW